MVIIMKDFVLEIPKWKGQIVFDYETISFVLLWLILISAILLCFWGYKYFQSICLMLLGSLCGVTGILIANGMTDHIILQVFFFVIFLFLGVCLFYFLSLLLVSILKILRIWSPIYKKEYLISAVLGSAVAGVTVYQKIFRNALVVAGASAVLGVWGILYSRKRIKERKPFLTYADLYRLEPLAEEAEND